MREHGATSIEASSAPAADPGERIGVLDVLRGIALLGMFLVHFNDNSVSGDAASGLSAMYQRVVGLFFEDLDGRQLEAITYGDGVT